MSKDQKRSISELSSQAFLLGLLVLSRTSVDFIRPTGIGKGNLLLFRLPIQMLISFKNTLTDTSKIIFGQMPTHPIGQSIRHIKLTITAVNSTSWCHNFRDCLGELSGMESRNSWKTLVRDFVKK